MKILKPGINLNKFFNQLHEAEHCALLLDYDGTLAPFHVSPGLARPYPGISPLLDAIMQNGHTRVILISGRWTRDLLPLTGLKHTPEIWGSHGWERLFPDGRYEAATPDETALRGLAEADTWIEEIIDLGGRTEQKPSRLAIHWRGLDRLHVERIRNLVRENWAMQAQDTGLALHDFDGGIELRVPGRNKGHALDTVLGEMPATTAAAYLGDDLTDEDAFHAIQGRGLGVLVREELRATAADLWLTPPRELIEFLTQWHQSRNKTETTNEMV